MKHNHDVHATVGELLDRVDVVSFDLFDTLIFRNILDPTDLFEMLRQRLGVRLDFRELRIEAQTRARDKFRPRIANHEATLSDIYDELKRYDVPALTGRTLDDVKKLELALEEECISENPYMQALFFRCLEQGKKVIITTDTYFEREFLERLLARCGYHGYHHLFISSEVGRSKHDGTIWKWLCEQNGVDASRLLHIGDNEGPDVRMPRRHGVRVVHYRSALATACADPSYRRVYDLYSQADLHNIAISQWLATVANRFFGPRPIDRTDDFYWFGFTYAGIVLVLFTHWLHKTAKSDGAERLLFLARDGYLLLQLYEALYPSQGGGLPSVYTYASRRTFRVPGVIELDDGDLRSLTETYQSREVRQYLERIGLDAGQYEQSVRNAGFESLDTIVTPERVNALLGLLRTLEGDILRRAEFERDNLRSYLEGIGALDVAKIGLVDVGWHGSLQKSYEKIVNDVWHANQKVSGYYLGLREPSVVFSRVGNLLNMRGFLCDLGLPNDNLDLILDGASVLEFVLYAPHGTALFFKRTANGVEPVLDDTIIEFNVSASQRIHAGVNDFAKLLGKASSLAQIADLEPFLRPIKRFARTPALSEARLFGQFQLSTDFGRYTSTKAVAAPVIGGGPLKLWRDYHRSNWKRGYLRQIPMGLWIGKLAEGSETVRKLARVTVKIKHRLIRLGKTG